ncbi:hypothetical protein GE09DRAFT_115601 [Coniochaeta sp. 2T2.1]|nr:hypothetical protein GE09DRAFT_115601 [Coniochaeta sp. 2T2.1]
MASCAWPNPFMWPTSVTLWMTGCVQLGLALSEVHSPLRSKEGGEQGPRPMSARYAATTSNEQSLNRCLGRHLPPSHNAHPPRWFLQRGLNHWISQHLPAFSIGPRSPGQHLWRRMLQSSPDFGRWRHTTATIDPNVQRTQKAGYLSTTQNWRAMV